MQHRRLTLAFIATGLVAACRDSTEPTPTAHSLTTRPAFAIVDGARGGNPRFFFLPPIVRPPAYTGTFDASQSPVVSICQLAGTTCGATVASFSGAAVKVFPTEQLYSATWKTKGAALDPTKTYRIQVLIGSLVLGYADVMVLSNGSVIKTVDTPSLTVDGGVLSIRFRIESGAATPGWKNGDMITFNQNDWGGDPATAPAAKLLVGQFGTVYPSGVEIGATGIRFVGYSALFTTANAVLTYLPALGIVNPLIGNVVDPTTTFAGAAGGEVLALQFNVDFSDAGFVRGVAGKRLGELSVCGIDEFYRLHGMTVRQYLAEANLSLGQGSGTHYDVRSITSITVELNNAFGGGKPSQFAMAHLVDGPCPVRWQTGDVIAYSQDSWGGDPAASTAAALVQSQFDLVYPGGFEIGIPGASGFSMAFTSGPDLIAYLPSSGVPGPLNVDLVNPTTTSSGIFGGLIAGLQLNLGFSAAGYIPAGNSGRYLHDLRLCGFTKLTALNGVLVPDFVAQLQQILGDPFNVPANLDDIMLVAYEVDRAFDGATPTAFAQIHLVNGACP